MSRRRVESNNDNETIVVGWDPNFDSFYAEFYAGDAYGTDTRAPKTVVGVDIGQFKDVDEFLSEIITRAQIPIGLRERLLDDRAAQPHDAEGIGATFAKILSGSLKFRGSSY